MTAEIYVVKEVRGNVLYAHIHNQDYVYNIIITTKSYHAGDSLRIKEPFPVKDFFRKNKIHVCTLKYK